MSKKSKIKKRLARFKKDAKIKHAIGRYFILMSMPNPNQRAVAYLSLPRPLGARKDKLIAIKANCTGNANVTFTVGQLAALGALITLISDSETDVQNGVPGAKAARDKAFEDAKVMLLNTFMPAIQLAADNNRPDSVTIIESTLFKVRMKPNPPKHKFTVENYLHGKVYLTAQGAKGRTAHEWMITNNPAQWPAWPNIQCTIQANTIVPHTYAAGTRVYFKHRLVTKDGPAEWENAIDILVI